jgi:lipopolysaccharide/colanic/teichoic acid biosynthesis glycosyltransferase
MIPRGQEYCRGMMKRCLDIGVALLALTLLTPLLLLIALLVRILSGPPVLFTQERIGWDGRSFRLLKFRSMVRDASVGPPITAGDDPRVTPLGRCLRATKLDELPQLFNVVRGEMSLVGPRPEVPRYVAGYTPEQRRVLIARPGLTDAASVLYRDEESLLAAVPEERREFFYLTTILPAKLRMNLEYIDRASLAHDAAIMLRTVMALLRLG